MPECLTLIWWMSTRTPTENHTSTATKRHFAKASLHWLKLPRAAWLKR